MKTLPEKVRAVLALFANLDKKIASLQMHSSLSCPPGCGRCCEKPAIEVSPLEFLPFALAVYDQGNHEEILNLCEENPESICVIFRSHVTKFGGLCSAYPYRGLMCRLFGYAARMNRDGQAELVTCRIIKEGQNVSYSKLQSELTAQSYKAPLFSAYYMRLRSIDAELCAMMPINQAIACAIKATMHYYSYRRRKSRSKGNAQF